MSEQKTVNVLSLGAGVQSQAFRHGPYVHLEQFMEEVERRASECAEEGLSFDSAFVDIARELAKEIEEGKA